MVSNWRKVRNSRDLGNSPPTGAAIWVPGLKVLTFIALQMILAEISVRLSNVELVDL
jgi:hypothetical protein